MLFQALFLSPDCILFTAFQRTPSHELMVASVLFDKMMTRAKKTVAVLLVPVKAGWVNCPASTVSFVARDAPIQHKAGQHDALLQDTLTPGYVPDRVVGRAGGSSRCTKGEKFPGQQRQHLWVYFAGRLRHSLMSGHLMLLW